LDKINPLKSSENLPSISYRTEKNDKRYQIVDVNHCPILRQITFVQNKTINVLFLFIHEKKITEHNGSFRPLGKQNPLKSSENLSSISYGIEKNEKRSQNVDVNHCALLRQITLV
jgi:endonuclease I